MGKDKNPSYHGHQEGIGSIFGDTQLPNNNSVVKENEKSGEDDAQKNDCGIFECLLPHGEII
jgi:hypothetical protein